MTVYLQIGIDADKIADLPFFVVANIVNKIKLSCRRNVKKLIILPDLSEV